MTALVEREAVLLRVFQYIDDVAGEMNGVPNEGEREAADILAGDIAEALDVPFDEDWPKRAAAAFRQPGAEYRRAVEDAAKVADEQTRLNAQARRDRADDTLAFEFEGLGNVIATAIRALSDTKGGRDGE